MTRFKLSDYIAFAALVLSGVALYETHEANSPKIVVTPVAERSYSTCNKTVGEWQTKTIMRFNISNIGGRATTLQRLMQGADAPPVLVHTADGQKTAASYGVTRLERLTELPDGSAAASWE